MNCNHDSVLRAYDANGRVFWKCDKCETKFVPGYAVAGMISEEVDTVAAVASAMLWDFHERAVEKYGKDSAQEEALRPGHDAPDECEPGDHIFKGDNCEVCNKSRWLGGNDG